MAKKILTKDFNIRKNQQQLQHMKDVPHYMFFAKITEYSPSDLAIPEAGYDQGSSLTSLYSNMIFGKKIQPSDLKMMIRRILWQSNTVYDQYSYSDIDMYNKDFYVATKVGSNYYVYKCLSNNLGVESTVQPSGTDITVFQTSDGYIWKYMYTFTEADDLLFSTNKFMPVQEDSNVKASAVAGTIDSIHLLAVGSEYPNSIRSNFATGDIRLFGDATQYSIDASASSFNNFYRGCFIRLLSGVGAGEYKEIISYRIENNKKIITIEEGFTNTPAAGDLYEIMPGVSITGNGTEQIPAKAIAIVDQVTGFITSIEVLNPGSGYTQATANVEVEYDSMVPIKAAVEPSISPLNGHGYDVFTELGSTFLSCSVTLEQDENGKIPVENDYRIVGVVENPLFNNVHLSIDNTSQEGRFRVGEVIYQIRKYLLSDTVAINNSSLDATSTLGNIKDMLKVGDVVLFENGTNNHITTITSFTDDDTFSFDRTCIWADVVSTTCSISLVSIVTSGVVSQIDNDFLVVGSLSSTFDVNVKGLIGYSSNATVDIDYADANNLKINGVDVEEFRVFNQLQKLAGNYLSSGEFVEDEIITQGTTSGVVHSTVNNIGTDYVYILAESGNFDTNSEITGSISNESFILTNKYEGQLEKNSGKVIYIENILPITRTPSSAENIRLILSS